MLKTHWLFKKDGLLNKKLNMKLKPSKENNNWKLLKDYKKFSLKR